MSEQIFTSDLKNSADFWNKRLREALKNKGYTQTEFAKKLKEQSGTEISQAMVSEWMRVGEKARNNRTIGFPIYSNMLLIAKALDVDVGYLLGETDMKTFTAEKACEYLNINEEALETILRITGEKIEKTTQTLTDAEKDRADFGYEPEKYSGILNKLFTSLEFIKCIEAAGELEDIFAQKRKSEQDLYQKYDNRILELAFKYTEIISEDEITEDISKEEKEILFTAINDFNKHIDLFHEIEYKIKICKYEIQESVIMLINRLYPYQ